MFGIWIEMNGRRSKSFDNWLSKKTFLVGVVNNILDSNHVLLKNAKDGSFHFHHQRR